MERGEVLRKIKDLESTIAKNFLAYNSEVNENIELLPQPTPTQMQIMEYIMKCNNQNVYQRDLENVLGIKRATVSGVLQTMEKNGLIERVTDETDTRAKRIILKEETVEIFERGKKKFEILEKEIVKGISEEDLNTFLNVIEKMKNNIK